MPDLKKSLLLTLEFPPQRGGVATYYFNVAKNLPADKIVVLAPELPETTPFDQKQNFTIIRNSKLFAILTSNTTANKFNLLKSLQWLTLNKELKKICKHQKIKLIQVGQVLPLGTVAMMVAKGLKIPYIIYTHGMDILLPQKSPRKKMLLKKIINGAQAVVANSHFTADELVKLGDAKEKTLVVQPCPNITATEVSEWKINRTKKVYGIREEKILLTVGRLVPRKGHDMVIKSLPDVLKKFPQTLYLIVGSGPYAPELKQLTNQLGLRDNVKFLDKINDDELTAFYHICDIFIMPTRQIDADVEGFGIAFLEANLFGKPVIAGKSGGVPEAVIDKQTGLLVDPINQLEITSAIIELLDDESYRERLGMQGLDRVIRDFNWENQVDKIKQILI